MYPLVYGILTSTYNFIDQIDFPFLFAIIFFFVFSFLFQVSANNILLLHLGIVDSILCMLFLIFSLPSIAKSDGAVVFEAICSVHGFLLTLMHPIALWTICCLNCDRYYAIAAPLHYSAIVNTKKVCDTHLFYTKCKNFNRKIHVEMKFSFEFCIFFYYSYSSLFNGFAKVLTGLICGWLVAFVLCIPPLFHIAPYRYNTDLGICAPHFEMSGTLLYALVFTLITLIIPSILIIGCNIRVSSVKLSFCLLAKSTAILFSIL